MIFYLYHTFIDRLFRCQSFGRGYVAIYVASLIKPSSVLNVGD